MQNRVEIKFEHSDIQNIINHAAPPVEMKIHKFVPPPLLRTKARRNIFTNNNDECKYIKNFN